LKAKLADIGFYSSEAMSEARPTHIQNAGSIQEMPEGDK
jgi:hypothetical protein